MEVTCIDGEVGGIDVIFNLVGMVIELEVDRFSSRRVVIDLEGGGRMRVAKISLIIHENMSSTFSVDKSSEFHGSPVVLGFNEVTIYLNHGNDSGICSEIVEIKIGPM